MHRQGIPFVARWGLPLLLLAGCRGDASTPALHTAAPPPAESESADEASSPSTASASGRDLWFPEGPGREAILARERRDYDAMREQLDEVLTDESIDEDTRGAAELLMALEHRRLDQHALAAERFAAARGAPGLEPIELRIRLWQAQSLLGAGQPERARALIEEVDSAVWAASSVGGDARMMEADARRRTDDPDGAIKAYRAYLSEHPKGGRRFEARTKLARLLAEREDEASRKEALDLFDAVRRGVPLSDYGAQATEAIGPLEAQLGPLRTGAKAQAFKREHALVRAEALLSRHRYAKAVKAVDVLVAKGKLSTEQRCRAYYVKGQSIFKQRRRADSRTSFDKAADECAKAGKALETTRVKSRYQGARGWYAAGQYAKAGKAFEAIATDHAAHSYADDALVLAGESWESHGDGERAAKAYRKAINVIAGDMEHEARRRLLVMLLSTGADEEALRVIDAALGTKIVDPVKKAKLYYLRGRVYDRLGRTEDADQAWLTALDEAPLAYPGLQALSRLRERGAKPFAEGLERLSGPRSEPPLPKMSAKGEAAARARVLARLGLGDEAREELQHGKVKGWSVVTILNQAGLYPAAQIELANLGTIWRSTPPGEDNRVRWEGAHPRPFLEIIGPGESEHGVPPWLTYAIMQTESRFDPGVTSFAGAKGLVQLMPSTASGLAKRAGVRIKGDGALHDPALNLDLGMRYLSRLSARYGGGDAAVALAIPSYNAGEGSVDRWLGERGDWDLDLFLESIPYDETRRYAQTVLGRWMAYRWLYTDGRPEERVPYLPLTTPHKVD